MYRAVIFDLGGVVVPSPFDAFDDYDRAAGLDVGTVRALIRASSETGAWAALERSALSHDEFVVALMAEADDAGFTLDVAELFRLIGANGGPRPAMLRAIERISEEGLKTAALTNNWLPPEGESETRFRTLPFDVVVESAVEGLRKPDERIYELVLARLDVDAKESIFLDDLGINLKPARAMGMTTIKVTDPAVALAELETALGFSLQ
jgi:putative hydrolase of the HAD superfamily